MNFGSLHYTRSQSIAAPIKIAVAPFFTIRKSIYQIENSRNEQKLSNKISSASTSISKTQNSIPQELLKENSTSNIAKLIKPLIKRHCELTEIRNMLEEIFSPGFFLTYYTTGITLCLYAFRLSISSDITEIFFLILAILTQANFLRIQCHFGQMFADAVDGIAERIYHCGWEEISDNQVKKMLFMVIIKSKNSLGLTNMKFSRVDMARLTTVCKIFDNS